jgi:hypothetical protein
MNWRALVAGGVFIALLIAAVLIARPEKAPIKELPVPARLPSPPVAAAPVLPLGRAELIDAAARAADAHARGAAVSSEDSKLVGRRFTLQLPFGCTGSADADSEAPLRWSYDPAEGTLRVSVTPNVWTDAAPVRAAAQGVEYEAAEGFWIERPWLRNADCPLVAPAQPQAQPAEPVDPANESTVAFANENSPTPVVASIDEAPVGGETANVPAPARKTLALVELFEPGSRRAARRNGRPYTVVTNIAPGEIDLSKGLRLVVTGRLAALRQGTAIVCTGTLIDERPLCMIGAEVDRVAITDASGSRILGEWGA